MTNEELREAIREFAESKSGYDVDKFNAAADALRKLQGVRRDLRLRHPVSKLRDWDAISEWQRGVWRKNLGAVINLVRNKGYDAVFNRKEETK